MAFFDNETLLLVMRTIEEPEDEASEDEDTLLGESDRLAARSGFTAPYPSQFAPLKSLTPPLSRSFHMHRMGWALGFMLECLNLDLRTKKTTCRRGMTGRPYLMSVAHTELQYAELAPEQWPRSREGLMEQILQMSSDGLVRVLQDLDAPFSMR